MAGGKSDYLENKTLDHVLGGGDYTRPGTVYLALYTATPSDVAASGTEVTGGSYVRLSITNNGTNFPSASAGVKSNGATFTFVQATADWGTVVAWSLKDQSTLGNTLYWGPLTPNKIVSNGDTASFAVGDLTISED